MSFMTLYTFLQLLLALAAIIYIYFKWTFTYWKRKGVPYLEPTFPLGNIESPLRRTQNFGFLMQSYYNQFRSGNHKYGGTYTIITPIFIPVDPQVIRSIMAKDFQHFTSRGIYYNEKNDPLSTNLFNVAGPKWRQIRTKLTPTFTSGKMKMMFQTIVDCGKPLKEKMMRCSKQQVPVDVKDDLSSFTLDVIGSCAFGLECNSFEQSESAFKKYGKKSLSMPPLKLMKLIFTFMFPSFSRKMGLKFFDDDVIDFYTRIAKDAAGYREANNISRKDFLQLLLDIKNGNVSMDDVPFTMDDLAAQAFVFFIAGYETSSALMSFCLYELSLNPEIQEKVRKEIDDVMKEHNGELTYEATQEMKYMGQVLDETLRKYPPVPVLHRLCTSDYVIPDTSITLPTGSRVSIPILGLHYDDQYFPEPYKFDPERFSDENRSKINPYSYLPFGEGPRNCIGLRFGIMQNKVGLSVLLQHFKFSLNSKTSSPLQMDPRNFTLSPEGGVWLDVECL